MQEFEPIVIKIKKGTFTIFPGLCKGCGLCIQKCPKQSLSWSKVLGIYGTPSVQPDDSCIACGICASVCPDCAISIKRESREAAVKRDEARQGPSENYPAL